MMELDKREALLKMVSTHAGWCSFVKMVSVRPHRTEWWFVPLGIKGALSYDVVLVARLSLSNKPNQPW